MTRTVTAVMLAALSKGSPEEARTSLALSAAPDAILSGMIVARDEREIVVRARG